MADRLEEMAAAMGEHWAGRVAYFRRDNARHAPGGVVMLGDSLTEHFPFVEFFPQDTPINRGIGGDTAAGVRARMDVSVRALRPRRVILLVGVNDLLWTGATTDAIARAYEALLDELTGTVPGGDVVVQPLLPVRGDFAVHRGAISDLNERIEAAAQWRGLVVLDVASALRGDDGLLRADASWDGVHLNRTGYELWAEVLRPML